MKHTDTGEHIKNKPCHAHEGHDHTHGENCGHKAAKHDDHIDYEHRQSGNKRNLIPARAPNFIPDEAIKISDEQRTHSSGKSRGAPPVDEYSSEKISPDSPTDADVKSGPVDDTVMPG